MILVNGVELALGHVDSSSQQGVIDILNSLVRHPALMSASSSYKALPERTFSLCDKSDFLVTRETRWVYIYQREYATVDPCMVDIVGTDGQQTCVGLVIRNPKTGRISVAHIIYDYIVDMGITQMISSIGDEESDDILDVHIIGGYNTSPQQSCRTWDGTSTFICLKIVEVLWKSNKRFNIQTMYILNDNTIYDEEGNAYPFLKGFLVETGNGSIFPATFHETTKGPDEYIRRIRERACLRDPNWDNRLLETYDIESDQFTIAYVSRGKRYLKYIESLRNQSDEELCNTYLTVPIPMTPHNIFVIRRDLEKLFQVPNWEEVFPFRRPRTFFRSIDGGWAMRTSEHNQILKRTANRVCQGRYNIQ